MNAAHTVSPHRRAMIAKVHLGAKELRLDETTRRDLMEQVTGQRSAADCSDAQLAKVLDELKARGWKPAVPAGRQARRTFAQPSAQPAADSPLARKIRALWISLGQIGAVRNASEKALEAFVKRQVGVEKIAWLRAGEGFKVVEALKAMAERAGWSQDVGDLVGEEAGVLLQKRLDALLEAKTGR